MRKLLLSLSFALLCLTGLFAQDEGDVQASTDCFGGEYTFDYVNTVGGYNVYNNPILQIDIRFSVARNRWEFIVQGETAVNFVFFFNTFASSPKPPSTTAQAWEDNPDEPTCPAAQAPIVSGTGTQDTMGGDPCEGIGDDDGDGFCNDVDVCPGHDDAIDPDMDGIPSGCDDNPNTPDGVLISAPCFGPDPILLTLSGNDGAHRNIYINNTIQLRMIYRPGDGQWVVESTDGLQTFFTNDFPSLPDPPDSVTSSWALAMQSLVMTWAAARLRSFKATRYQTATACWCILTRPVGRLPWTYQD